MILRNILICSLLFAVTFAVPASKVAPKLAASLKAKNLVNIFVKFHGDTTDTILRVQNLRSSISREDKITHIVSTLQLLSKSSQQNALKFLRSRSPFTSHKQVWISNELYIKGASSQLVQQLTLLPEVKEIREERVLPLEPLTFKKTVAPQLAQKNQWNLEKVEAELAWNLVGGNKGSGVVVANIDTGVRGTHEALRDNQRTNYSWFDPFENTEEAYDSKDHGTHAMGTTLGTKGIGIAPEATWIACRGCGLSGCPEITLKECGQWVLCPTLPNGQAPNCSLAPRIVSNSWGGGQGSEFYNEVIEAWKAANIIPVFAMGNTRQVCGSAMSPADQDVIAVGATTENDNITWFSAGGPSVYGDIRPHISAPGDFIWSSSSASDTAYAEDSGTSMATPLVAGAVALLIRREPNLTYEQVKEILTKYADRDTLADTGSSCGGIPSTQFPNNQYGYGRLNVHRALAAVISGSYK